jgi:two-component system cell cycle response regulator
MRVLITENNRLYCQLLNKIFVQLGFHCDICHSIESARTYLESETYDLICINQYLGDESGIEFAEYCNNHKHSKETPILFLTNNKESVKDIESLHISEVVLKKNRQQISAQITRFVLHHLDPIFHEGRILLIEDSKAVASVILDHLKATGYKTLHFLNGEDAWATFKKEKTYGSGNKAFDLVISDIMLEGKMSGKEVIENIRCLDDARAVIPIIAITGDNTDKLRLSLYQIGVNDFLKKPFLTEELLIRVHNLIANKRLLDKVHDQRRELYTLATTDKLTGCRNRHSLMEFSGEFLSQASQHGYPVSLLVLDLDHFKSVNDTHGHAMGDAVLEAIGKLLNASFSEEDLVARFGGEEFIVLINHCDAENAKITAENLRQNIELLKPCDLDISASIGLSSIEIGQNTNFDILFSLADKGVYQAKNSGRNRVIHIPIGSNTFN